MNRFNQNIALFYEMDELKPFLIQDMDSTLSSTDINMINILYFHQLDSVKDLCTTLGCSNALISKIIKRLYLNDYLNIENDAQDKRIKLIQLSEKGIKIAEALNKRLYDFFSVAFSQYSDDEIELFIQMFNECSSKFKKMKNERKFTRGGVEDELDKKIP